MLTVLPMSTPPTDPLQDARNTQIQTLTASCAAAVNGDFYSKALGTERYYSSALVPALAAALANATTARALSGPWRPSSLYSVGNIVVNGYRLYRCVQSGADLVYGSSGEQEPWFPVYAGATVTDGDLTWACWSIHLPSFDTVAQVSTSDLYSLDEALQVLADSSLATELAYTQLDAFVQQVNAAQTVADVQAINWH
jgi:hypothetical protein